MIRALVLILASILVMAGCTNPNFEPRPNKAPGSPEPGVRAQDIAPSPVFIPLSEKGKKTGKKGMSAPPTQAEAEAEAEAEDED